MVIVNQDRGMPDIGLWLYALTQHSMTNRYAALNENMIYHCPHDVVPLYEKRLYSAFQFMHQLLKKVLVLTVIDLRNFVPFVFLYAGFSFEPIQ